MLLRILAALTAILILTYEIGAFFVLPEFEQLFVNFGDKLPLSTKIVIVTYPYWLVALIIPIGIYVKYLTRQELSKKVKNRILFVFVSMLLFSIVLLPLIVTAMYMPIFELEPANN